MVRAAKGAMTVWDVLADVMRYKSGKKSLTRPLMMPPPRVRRARALADVGLEVSLMPSAALGMESLPPMMKVFEVRRSGCRSFQMRVRHSATSQGAWWGWSDLFG